MYDIIIDCRPVISRTAQILAIHHIDFSCETMLALQQYLFVNLIVDLIRFGNETAMLPGNIHYRQVKDKVEAALHTELDEEILNFVLEELEYELWRCFHMDVVTVRILSVSSTCLRVNTT